MTRNDVQVRIAEIRENADFNALAHEMEDALRRDFLHALVQLRVEPDDIVDLAQLVLSTDEIEFARWCA